MDGVTEDRNYHTAEDDEEDDGFFGDVDHFVVWIVDEGERWRRVIVGTVRGVS